MNNPIGWEMALYDGASISNYILIDRDSTWRNYSYTLSAFVGVDMTNIESIVFRYSDAGNDSRWKLDDLYITCPGQVFTTTSTITTQTTTSTTFLIATTTSTTFCNPPRQILYDFETVMQPGGGF